MSRFILSAIVIGTIIILLQDSMMSKKRMVVEGYDTTDEKVAQPPTKTVAQTNAVKKIAQETGERKPVTEVQESTEPYDNISEIGSAPFDTSAEASKQVSFADGSGPIDTNASPQEPTKFPDATHAFGAADANALFASGLASSQFGDVNMDPSSELLPQTTVSGMSEMSSVHDTLDISQEELIDLASQCQSVSTLMSSGSGKPLDIRGSLAPPKVNTGVWMQATNNGIVDTPGLCA